MSGLCYQRPSDGHICWTAPSTPPPADHTVLLSGSDGSGDRDLKQFTAGVNSGGYPAYTGDPTQPAPFVNGRLS